MLIKKTDIGRMCLVQYDDTGRVNGILVDCETDETDVKVFSFATRELLNVNKSQVVALGDHVNFVDVAGKSAAIILQK